MEYVTPILCTLLTLAGTVIVAIITKKGEKQRAADRKKDERRQKEARLQLEMAFANSELTIAVANAVLGKKNNGNVEKAYEYVAKSQSKYREFERDLIAEETA